MIAATQFSFTIALVSFVTASWQSLAREVLGLDLGIWTVAVFAMVILTLLAWIRDISAFSFTLLIGNICILTTVVVATTVVTRQYFARGGEFGPGLQAWNQSEYWAMVGFSCYSFEGIGVVMPILSACECPEKFDKLYFAAICTLAVIYILFADWAYLVLGTGLKRTFITEELDQGSAVVMALQAVYSLSVVCSYALFIFPANQILEDYLFHGLSKRAKAVDRVKAKKYTNLRYYLSNLTRFLVCFAATYTALELGERLHKFLSVLGALLCAPLAILLPALLHMKQVASTTRERLIDLAFVIIAVIVMAFSTGQVVSSW